MTPRHYWTESEEAVLRERYADTPTVELAQVLGLSVARVLHKANAMGLLKSRAFIAETARQRTAAPDHASHAYRFASGLTPWNKGKAGLTGLQPGCRATQFGPGAKPHTWVPVGSYRVNPDGALERKINDDPGPTRVRWTPVARLVWEAANGPVPPGHLVAFKPGRASIDPAQITLDAVELLTRKQIMQRNSCRNLPPELSAVVQLRGMLTRQINKRLKKDGCAETLSNQPDKDSPHDHQDHPDH